MSFALKGMITGAARGISSIMEDERKTTSAIIANKTKLAFENYQQKQREDAAILEEIKKRDAEARLLDQDLTEAQRIAIGSDINNVFLTKYKQIIDNGNPNKVKLGDLIKFKDQVPEQAFDAWVKSSVLTPTAAAEVKPVREETMLGMSAAGQIAEAEKYASSVGLTAAQLAAFEKPAERTVLSPIAFLNQEALKLPESPDQTRVRLFNTLRTGKPDEIEAAKVELAKFGETQEMFDKLSGNVRWTDKLAQDRAKAYAINNEPSKYSKDEVTWASNYIKVEVDRELQQRKLMASVDRDNRPKDASFIATAIRTAVSNDMEKLQPFEQNGAQKYKLIDENGKLVTRPANHPDVIKAIDHIKRTAPLRVLSGLKLLGEDGELKVEPQGQTMAQLFAADIPLYQDRKSGKTYIYDGATRQVMKARSEGKVVDLIRQEITNGTSPEQIIGSNLFTQQELDAAGVKKPAMPEAPPAGPTPATPSVPMPPMMQTDGMQIAP